MPNDEKPEGVSVTKKVILRELKAQESDIDAIRNNAEADELIKFYQDRIAKAEKKENQEPSDEEKKNLKKNMLGQGKNDFELPDPGTHNEKLNLGYLDLTKPMRVNNYTNNRWGNARIMRCFGDDEYPEGRVL